MSERKTGNLFSDIPEIFSEEIFNPIFEDNSLKIERIVSQGHCTAKNQWLEQGRDEWVVVIKGNARLLFKEPSQIVELKPGDYLLIKADTQHRVEWTDPKQKTVWLAVHGTPKQSNT
ncbi:MAG: cupin domain-containing protein [Candidatus Omnitrophica bacterium]|nr:cupin domain-containing protein [Candidatus Omnitrophota bacterium]